MLLLVLQTQYYFVLACVLYLCTHVLDIQLRLKITKSSGHCCRCPIELLTLCLLCLPSETASGKSFGQAACVARRCPPGQDFPQMMALQSSTTWRTAVGPLHSVHHANFKVGVFGWLGVTVQVISAEGSSGRNKLGMSTAVEAASCRLLLKVWNKTGANPACTGVDVIDAHITGKVLRWRQSVHCARHFTSRARLDSSSGSFPYRHQARHTPTRPPSLMSPGASRWGHYARGDSFATGIATASDRTSLPPDKSMAGFATTEKASSSPSPSAQTLTAHLTLKPTAAFAQALP